ncbi:MAG: hypothetical protein ACI4LM_04145 [Anaerovoracaceae bacterium]
MKLRKVTALLLALAVGVTSAALTGCQSKDDTQETEALHSKIDKKIDAYTTDFEDSMTSMDVRDYLKNWAESKDISCATYDSGNIVMTVPASKSYKKADPVVIICPYDSKQLKYFMSPIIMTLYLIKNNESTGKLTAVFTPESGHDLTGIRKLDKKYITDDSKVICLNGAATGNFALNTGGGECYKFSTKASYKKPSYTKAYTISLKNMPGGQLSDDVSKNSNPVLVLENLLISLQRRNINFEVASFRGGNSKALCPEDAEVTIVVDANDEETFTERMDTVIENFNDSKSEEEKDETYSYKKAAMPSKVLKASSSNKMLSFLYTVLTGRYESQKDKEEAAKEKKENKDTETEEKAYTDVASIRTGSRIVIYSAAYSNSKRLLKEINNDESTLAYLSGINFSRVYSIPVWNGNTSKSFSDAIKKAYQDYSGNGMQYADSITPTNANYISRLNSKCDVISLTVSDNIMKNATGMMVTYLKSLKDDDSSDSSK